MAKIINMKYKTTFVEKNTPIVLNIKPKNRIKRYKVTDFQGCLNITSKEFLSADKGLVVHFSG